MNDSSTEGVPGYLLRFIETWPPCLPISSFPLSLSSHPLSSLLFSSLSLLIPFPYVLTPWLVRLWTCPADVCMAPRFRSRNQ